MLSFASRRLRAILAVTALLVALGSAGLWLRSSSLVRVSAVTVTGIDGRQGGEVREALTVAGLGMSTLAVDEEALRNAVAAFAVVGGVRATTDFPHGLRVAVDVRRPVAALQSGDALTAVAADGTILRDSITKGLPAVGVKTLTGGVRVDAETLPAIRLIAAAPARLRGRVSRVFRGPRGLAATVERGPKLYFGGGERLRAKWTAAAEVLGHGGAQGASYVDLRIPERPVAGGFAPQAEIDSPSTLG